MEYGIRILELTRSCVAQYPTEYRIRNTEYAFESSQELAYSSSGYAYTQCTHLSQQDLAYFNQRTQKYAINYAVFLKNTETRLYVTYSVVNRSAFTLRDVLARILITQ